MRLPETFKTMILRKLRYFENLSHFVTEFEFDKDLIILLKKSIPSVCEFFTKGFFVEEIKKKKKKNHYKCLKKRYYNSTSL